MSAAQASERRTRVTRRFQAPAKEREFPASERGVFIRLLEGVFDQMQLGGEAGSLLKIEEAIRSAIAEAKQLWKEEPVLEQSKLFAQLKTG